MGKPKEIEVRSLNDFHELVEKKYFGISEAIVQSILGNLKTRKKNIHVLSVKCIEEATVFDITLEKVQTLIDKKQAQISRLDEDEDLKDLTDAKKVKEISKDIKSLEKAKAKLEKMMHKGKAKSPRKEVIDEDDVIDEVELNSEFDI